MPTAAHAKGSSRASGPRRDHNELKHEGLRPPVRPRGLIITGFPPTITGIVPADHHGQWHRLRLRTFATLG